ncbi:MAG: hypothetical protein QW461_09805 [Candidatus Jordarchaeales archaeon]
MWFLLSPEVFAMILGYLLLDEGGTPLVAKELVRVLLESDQVLFSGVVVAIGRVVEEVFKSRVRHVELENLHLYFAFGRKFNLVMISDVRDDRLIEISDEAVTRLDRTGVDPLRIQFDDELKQRVIGEVERVVFRSPPSILSVKRLAEVLLAGLDVRKGMKLGFAEVKPKIYKPGILGKIRKLFTGRVTLKELVDAYYKADFSRVVEAAPSLFDDKESGELAKILYAKAALTLNSFDPEVEAPPLDEINTVIESIKDEVAREFLKAELESFLVLGAYNRRRELFVKKQMEFFRGLSGEKVDVYSILLTPLPYGPLLDFLERKHKGKSSYLYGLTIETKFLLDILTKRPKDISEVFSLYGRFKREFDEAYKRKSPEVYVYFHVLQFILVWGLLEKSILPDDGVKLLKQILELFESYRDELVDKGLYYPNRYKAVNIYFALNLILRLLLELGDEFVNKRLDKYYDYARSKTEWLIGLGKTHRVMLDMYYVSLAGLLSVLSRLAAEKGIFLSDVPNLVIELASPEMEEFWNFNEYHFVHYYVDMLDAIGNTALFVEFERVKQNLLMQVAYGIESAAELFRDTPIVHDIELLKAVRFYMLSGTSQGVEAAKSIVSKLKETSSPFIASIAEKIVVSRGG